MDGEESLSSILSSSTGDESPARAEAAPAPPAEAPKVEARTEGQETEAKAPTRDESGRFTKAEEPKAEVKAEPKEQDGRTAALRAERQRRQQLEAKLRELEGQKPAQKVSIFEDEEQGISQRVDERTQNLKANYFNLSIEVARLRHKESFEAAEAAFFDAAEQDPRLYDQLRGAGNPGDFIYHLGTQYAELAPVGGDFVKYREKVTGELKAELGTARDQITALTAEIEKLKKGQAALESIPRSLNKGNESAPRSTAEADDDDLKSIARFSSRAS